jgi:flagella basal body P-ring formation protein FlgA
MAFAQIAGIVRHGWLIITIVLACTTVWLILPSNNVRPSLSKPPIPPFVPPDMVDVPVPRQAIAAGAVIHVDHDIETRSFVSAELEGKVLQTRDLTQVIAKNVLVRGQPISTGDVEPFVRLPVADAPQDAGVVIKGDAGFSMREVGLSQVQGTQVLSLSELQNKLVVSPIAAELPIPLDSLDDYVILPVLRVPLASGAPFRQEDLIQKTVPYNAIKSELDHLILSVQDLLDSPQVVAQGQNIAPDTPIKRNAVSTAGG